MKLEKLNLKRKILISTFIIILFLGIVISLNQYRLIKDDIKNSISIKNNYINKAFDVILNEQKVNIVKHTNFVFNSEAVSKALKKRDKEKLYSLMKITYKKILKYNPYLKIMTFRLPDGSAFLKVHKPEIFEDKLDKKREIILDTISKQTIQYGFEVGKAKITYSVVIPIFYEDTLVGVVELGVEPEFITNKLESVFDIKTALLIKKEFKETSLSKKYFKENENWLLAKGDKFFNQIFNQINLKKTNNYIELKDKTYYITPQLSLHNHLNQTSAKILIAYSIQTQIDKYYISLTDNIFITAISLIIFFIVLNLGLNFYARMIAQVQKKLNENNIQLEKQNVKLEKAQKISKLGFWSIEHKTGKLTCSTEIYKIYMIKERVISSIKVLLNRTHPDDIRAITQIFKDAVENKTPYEIEYRLLMDDKKIKWVKAKITTSYDKNHKPILSLGTIQDVTKEHNLNGMIHEKEMMLFSQSKLASMGDMIANIAHQWRQPLSIISTDATGIKMQKEFGMLNDEFLEETVDSINKNAQYLSKTIDTFRDFIKEEKESKIIILQKEIDKTLEILQTPLKAHHIKLINNIDYDSDIEIELISGELMQVLINIVNNAKDHLLEIKKDEPWISLSIEKFEHKVIIKIEDNGGGIPQKVMPQIFNPYFTTKDKSKGTGLGLYMSYKIVTESLNGKLYAKNSTNGAVFYIELPL